MDNTRPMTFMILDDDIDVWNKFENLSNSRNDIQLIAKTASSFEAIKLAKKLQPEAIIVDIELPNGCGTGFEFLTELRDTELDFMPLVIVNTKVRPGMIYDGIHEGFADIIFYKQQEDYRIEYVINAMLFSRKKNYKDSGSNTSCNISLKDKENIRISKLIDAELNAVGISPKHNGRQYIFDAISVMLEKNPKTPSSFSPFNYLADKYDMYASNVSRDIHTAISKAWLTTPIEDLEENYTAPIEPDTGEPTPLEFIFYYYKKIKELI